MTVPAEALGAREGLYRDTTTGTFRRLAVRGGKLIYVRGPDSASELVPIAADRFVMADVPADVEVAFPAVASGARARMTVTIDGAKPVEFEAVEEAAPTAAALADYTGTYYSEEVESIVRVKAESGALLVADRYDPKGAPLEPTVHDEFSGPGISVAFARDEKGRVAGLTISAGRVRNIGFVRRQ